MENKNMDREYTRMTVNWLAQIAMNNLSFDSYVDVIEDLIKRAEYGNSQYGLERFYRDTRESEESEME